MFYFNNWHGHTLTDHFRKTPPLLPPLCTALMPQSSEPIKFYALSIIVHSHNYTVNMDIKKLLIIIICLVGCLPAYVHVSLYFTLDHIISPIYVRPGFCSIREKVPKIREKVHEYFRNFLKMSGKNLLKMWKKAYEKTRRNP